MLTTTPTEVTPVCKGMNHAHPDSSEEENQRSADLRLETKSVPVSASNHGAPVLVVPSPYEPAPAQYPHMAIFLSESVNFRFFRYLVDIRPARPVASTRYSKVIVPSTVSSASGDGQQVYAADTGLLFSSNPRETTFVFS